MLRKLISIKNVGRCVSYGASKGVELTPYNLIFAENGRGKTTRARGRLGRCRAPRTLFMPCATVHGTVNHVPGPKYSGAVER